MKAMETEMETIDDIDTIIYAAFSMITSSDCEGWVSDSGIYIIVRQRIRGSTRFRSPSVVAMATARGLLNRVDPIGCAVQLI